MKRVFIDWNQPPLASAAGFLTDTFMKNGCLDMRNAVLVLPGQRAADRLAEILAEKAETMPNAAWYPPAFVSLENLPEEFYEAKKEFAPLLSQIFAWIQALDQIENEHPDLLRVLIAKRPNSGSVEARLTFGEMFNKLHTELASDLQDFSHVAELCSKLNLTTESARWEALRHLEKKYLDILDAQQTWDKQAARLYAVEHPEELNAFYRKHKENKTRFFLIGCTDLNTAQKQILSNFGDIVTAIIFAPIELESGFDSYGCLVPDVWQGDKFVIPLNDRQIIIADKPEDQADAAVSDIAAVLDKHNTAQIAVAAPDDTDLPVFNERFTRAGIKSRYVPGKLIQQTSPYRFLESWAVYEESLFAPPLYSALAALIRHPAVDSFLNEPNLLTQIDKEYNIHLPLTLDTVTEKDAVTTKDSITYKAMQKLNSLLTPGNGHSAGSHTAGNIERVLLTLFGSGKETPEYKKIMQELKEVEKISDTDVLRILLFQLKNVRIAPPADHSAIEIIGWLDTALDDAQAVIITGFNDGKIPRSVTSDIFLPDKVRQLLHLEDNRKRYARDAYNLSLILASRPQSNVRVITAKQSGSGDPLLPSRLLFAAGDKTTAERVKDFFHAGTSEVKISEAATAEISGIGEKRHNRQRPLPAAEMTSLSVTAFKTYIECPYRFYLRHVLKLAVLDDRSEEMTPTAFGSLIHEVLYQFGKSERKDSDNADVIREYLLQTLEDETDKLFGQEPRATAAIQKERAKERLRKFAGRQAAWRQQGYKIECTEYPINDIELKLPDGDKLLLHARIDRIDRHEKTDEWVVFDYKTGKSEPEKAHRKKKGGEWIDLQLPLYDYVLRSVKDTKFTGKIQLGYFILPPDLDNTGVQFADWSTAELDEAVTKAREIAVNIRAGNFVMSPKPPNFDDFAVICQLEQ
ncbi:MAG: PD-(D/E)XK nuclease family protein [Planctomycetaceae bacterium]|nr:PD-(D/E)XK nuclease family protein [Planctomycetaceae bacterium]